MHLFLKHYRCKPFFRVMWVETVISKGKLIPNQHLESLGLWLVVIVISAFRVSQGY